MKLNIIALGIIACVLVVWFCYVGIENNLHVMEMERYEAHLKVSDKFHMSVADAEKYGIR